MTESDLRALARPVLTSIQERLSRHATGENSPYEEALDLLVAFVSKAQQGEREDVLSSPTAAGLLLTLKAECEAQHARADTAEARLSALVAQVQGLREHPSVIGKKAPSDNYDRGWLLALDAVLKLLAGTPETQG